MKKGLLIVASLICTLVAQAGPVDRVTAQQKAQAFMLTKGRSVPQSASPAGRAPRKTVSGAQDASSYYVFNADGGGGFVIISGDDRTLPVLGYSLTGSFDPDSIPDNMQEWLQGYADEIEALDAAGQGAAASADADANVPQAMMSAPAIEPLVPSRWNQYAPYSDNCPYYSAYGENCVTGCVATAMAQVMYYHRWPQATTQAIPAYTTRTHGISVAGIPAGSRIDWDNMLDRYATGAYTSAQGQAVAGLMQYCGVSVEMDYCPWQQGGSGAYTMDVAKALKTYFDYDPDLYYADRANYTIAAWNSLLYDELSNGRPLVYCGSSTGGGHCFVIDGYDGDSYFHVNWGWGGYSDGYFAISVLNPYSTSGAGASSSPDGYTRNQGAIIGVQPAGSGSPVAPPTVATTDRMTTENLTVNGTVISCSFWNYTGETYSFDFGYRVLRTTDNVDAYDYRTVSSLSNYYGFNNENTASQRDVTAWGLSEGTYRITPVSRISGTDEWLSFDPERQYFIVVVSADGSVTVEAHPAIDLTVTAFTPPANPAVGSWQKLTATVTNNADEYNGTLYFFVKADSDAAPSFVMQTGVAIPAGGSTDIEFFVYTTAKENYHCYVATSCNGLSTGVYTIDYDKVIGEYDFNLSGSSVVSLEYCAAYLYTEALTYKDVSLGIVLANTGDDFDGKLHMFYALQDDYIATGERKYRKAYDFSVLSGDTAQVYIDFVPDKAGTWLIWLTTDEEGSNRLAYIGLDITPEFDVELTLPENAVAGTEQSIAATLTKNGKWFGFEGSIYMWCASQAQIDGDLTELTPIGSFTGLTIALGASQTLTSAFTPDAAGTYYVWLSKDAAGRQILCDPVTFSVAEPAEPVIDLVVSKAVLDPEAAVVGTEQKMTFTVVNRGDDFNGQIAVTYTDESGGGTVMGDYVEAIAAGDSVDIVRTFTPTEARQYVFNVVYYDKETMSMVTIYTMTVDVQPAPEPSELLGDANGNGRIDVQDVVALSGYITSGNEQGVIRANCDVNGDGRINVIDVVEIVNIILSK